MEQPLSLESPVQEEPGLSLDDSPSSVSPVQGSAALNRATKMHMALGDRSPGIDSIANSIQVGQEDYIRVQASQILQQQKQQAMLEKISRMAISGEYTPQQAQGAVEKARGPRLLDPMVDIEKGFADKYLQAVVTHNQDPDSIIGQATRDAPEELQQAVIGTNAIIARREMLRKGYEDALARYQKQSWVGWGINVAKGMIPGVTGTELSPDWNPINIALPGSTLNAERDKLWSIRDLGEAYKFYMGRIEAIAAHNPNAALDYAKAMVSFPSNEVITQNLMGVGDIQNVGGAITAVGKVAVTLAAAKKLLRQSVDGISPTGEISKERIAASLGDLKEAGDLRSAKELLKKADPTGTSREVSDQVHTIMRPEVIESFASDNLQRERAQRVIPILKQKASQIMDAMLRPQRVNRTEEELLAPMLKEADEMISLHYPSTNHGVLDVKSVYVPASNTWFAERIIGKRDGTLFRTAAQAENYAFREYGLTHESFSVSNQVPDNLRDRIPAKPLKNKPSSEVKVEAIKPAEKPLNTEGLTPQEIQDLEDIKKLFTPAEEPKASVNSSAVSPKQEKMNTIAQQGNGFYISLIKPFNEVSPSIRNQLITTTNQNPVSLANWWLGSLARSAEDQLSYFGRGNRHVATHTPQEIQRIMVEMAKDIGTLKKESHAALERVLIINRDYIEYGPKGEVIRGKAYNNQNQLEKAWWDVHERLPTDQESLAYWSYHQLMGADWMMRNFGVHRDLARQGVEQFTVAHAGTPVEKTSFPGRFDKDIPWGHKENIGVAVVNQNMIKHYWLRDIERDADLTNMLKNLHERGELKVLTVANPTDRPFKETAGIGNTVNIVLSQTHEVKPLSMNLVDWNPGVHIMYPQQHFVKQPILATGEKGITRYYGDRTLFAVDTEAEAKRIGLAVTELQKMIRNNATDVELNRFIERNLPEDTKYWKKKFSDFLDMDQPIGNTFSGRGFYDTHTKPTNVANERNSEFNLFRSIDMDFLTNRNGPLDTVTKGGTAEKAMYQLETARTLDPFESISRGLNNGVRNMITNDSKISAIEQWTAQYAHLAENPEAAAKNPFSFFYDFIKLNESTTLRDQLASAKNTRERTTQFVGSSSELGRDLNILQQKLLNSMGESGARWYNDHELKFIKDPISFTKSWMTHFRFGFFNPAQFVVQSMGFAHVLAVAGPEAAYRGISGYTLMRAAGMTQEPAVLNRLANIATKFGWQKEHFLEAYNSMRSLGFDIIGREHSMRSDAFDPQIFTKGKDTFFEWGMKPFTEGERLTRMTSWATAYHEWRMANPDKVLGQFDVPKILLRADDLSLNMTKASHSGLQEGVFSIPTQFYTFSHRIMEQFWGGRLTPTERIRAFATHSALFGIPIAAAAAFPWPIQDSLKTHLMEQGSPLLENGWYKAATEGFLSFVVEHATGKDYNVEQRYGPGFSDYLKKAIGGELSAIELAGGASGTFLKNIAKSLYPFYANLWIGAFGGQEELPLTKDDIMGVLREISSVNNFHNAWYAVNTGKYFSKNGELIANNLDAKDAAAIILSLTRKDITDTRLLLGSLKDQKDAQLKIQVLAEREFKRAFTYMSDNDFAKGEVHLVRAKALMVVMGDFRDEQIADTLKKATNDMKSLVDRLPKEFTEKGYKSQLPTRLQRLFDGNGKQ